MKKVLWISIVALVAAATVVGTAAARKYRSSHHNSHNNGAFLGVSTRSVTDRLAERLDLPVNFGAVIDRVYDDTPADEVGLREDDVIIELNGAKVRDSEDLADMLDDLEGGDQAKLVIRRDGDTINLDVTLDDQDEFFDQIRFPSGIGAVIAPRVPRAPSAPNAPQAFWFDPHQSYMGISMMDLTRQLGDYFGVDKSRGVLITEVERDSPAETAGLKAGDVIVKLDGDRIFDSEDIQDIVAETDAGDKLAVVVLRDKKEVQLEVVVAERDNAHQYYNSLGSISIPDIDISNGNAFWYNYNDREDLLRNYSKDFRKDMRKLKEELHGLKDELRDELRDLDGVH